MGFVPEWLRGAHPQEPSPAPLLNPKSPRHSGEVTATPNPRRASLQATAPLTGDAEAVLVAGLLEGKEPPEEPSEGQEGQEGTSSRRRHPADGRVGPPVAAHDVGVQVDVLEADGRPPHHQAAAHLPVQAMHGPWAGRKHSPGTFLPNPGAPGALPAACPPYLRAGTAARCRSRRPGSGSRGRWRSRCRRRAGSSARGAGRTSPCCPRCR